MLGLCVTCVCVFICVCVWYIHATRACMNGCIEVMCTFNSVSPVYDKLLVKPLATGLVGLYISLAHQNKSLAQIYGHL